MSEIDIQEQMNGTEQDKKQGQQVKIGFVNLDKTTAHERKTGNGDIFPKSHE
jgi:hypothetical protein